VEVTEADDRVWRGISQRLDATTRLRSKHTWGAAYRRGSVSALATLVAVGAIALVAGLGHLAATGGSDPRAGACPRDPHPDLAFPLDHARDIWSHLPKFGQAPELDVDQPAFVAVYSGPVNIRFTGNPRAGALGAPVTNLVCVVVNGSPNYYPGVDLTGARG
jgi:hypothetical protein